MSKLEREYLSDPAMGSDPETPENRASKKRKADEDLVYTETIVAPDGGYGWIILIASFFVNCIVDGIIFSFGILKGPIEESFGSNGIAWVGSCMAGFYLLAGPIVSGLCNKYGARIITVVGATIAAISLAMSFTVQSMGMLILCYGVLAGIGFGFAYLPSIVIVGEYFEKRRAFATGLAVSGSGVGGFVFAQVNKMLVEAYGWRGAMLFLGGIAFNCAVFGSLFRPLLPVRRLEEPDQQIPSEAFLRRIQDARDARINKLNVESGAEMRMDRLDETDLEKKVEKTYIPGSNGGLNETQRMKISQTNVNRRNSTASRKSVNTGSQQNVMKPDALYAGSLQNLPEVRAHGGSVHDFRQAVSKQAVDGQPTDSRCDAVLGVLRQMLDVSLLKSPTFLLTCITSFLTLAGFFIPFFYIVQIAESDKGGNLDSDQSTIVLMAISITNTLGRVVVGFAADHPRVDPIVVACSAITLGGVATFFLPFYSGFAMYTIYALVFGLSISAFSALRSIMLVDLFGIAMLNNSFGLQMVFQGVATLVGSPIAQKLKDATGTDSSAFYFAGALLTLSGILLFPAKIVKRWEKRRFPGNFSS